MTSERARIPSRSSRGASSSNCRIVSFIKVTAQAPASPLTSAFHMPCGRTQGAWLYSGAMGTVWITFATEDNVDGDVDYLAQEISRGGMRTRQHPLFVGEDDKIDR